MNVKFSVIMPVYNAEKTLEKAIKSVLNDCNKNVELVIVNDGSTDNSEEIIKQFVSDPRLSYYVQKNSGVSSARNYGLSVAKGEYVAFLDSDDYFTEDAFVKLTEYADEYNSDMIGFGFYSEKFSNGKLLQTNANTVSKLLEFSVEEADEYLDYIFCSSKILLQTSWNKVFKKSIIIDNKIVFNTNQVCYENLTFVFEFMKCCDTVLFVPQLFYAYCSYGAEQNILLKRRGNDLTSNVSVCMKSFVELTDMYGYSQSFRIFMYEHFFKDFTYCSKKIFLIEKQSSKKEAMKLFVDFLDDKMFLLLKEHIFGGFKFYRLIYFLHNKKMDLFAYEFYKRRIK